MSLENPCNWKLNERRWNYSLCDASTAKVWIVSSSFDTTTPFLLFSLTLQVVLRHRFQGGAEEGHGGDAQAQAQGSMLCRGGVRGEGEGKTRIDAFLLHSLFNTD